jgi:hypothetical protein
VVGQRVALAGAAAVRLRRRAGRADPAGGVDETTVDFGAPSGGKDDAAFDAELRLRVADTTLWTDRYLGRTTSADGTALFALQGRTSRNLTDGRAFVFDDVYGTWGSRGTGRPARRQR